jgi:protein Tex
MGFTTTIDLAPVASSLSLPLVQVESAVRLLDAGNTIPFITRYRKDQTGGLDEQHIRRIQDDVNRLRMLVERKQTILRSIDSQGKLTQDLAAAIESADSIKRLEDLYLPYKPKKQSLATIARERKLEPLAEEILQANPAATNLDTRAADFIDADRQVNTVADVLLGVGHILAEDFSERADLRGRLRKIVKRSGQLVSAKTEIAEQQGKEFRDYFEFKEPLNKLPPHRVLAINRGERAKVLRVKIEADDKALSAETEAILAPADHPHVEFLRACARDALERLVLPSLEREIRREMTEAAESHAVHVFARNLRNLLLLPPVRSRRVLAVDPGFKSGCKLAALDEFGNLLDQAVIHLVGKEERKLEGRKKLVELIKQHNLVVMALGNGTACRETEELLGELLANELKDDGVAYVIVNEAGASVYSTSPLGREELAQYDATLRSAISIGRRLLDPLSELVKIDPGSLGVGLYQHDVKAKHLRASLDAVVESCVNYVGVDVNTASPALLRYVSGLNQLTARRVYDHRLANGPFRNREQLKEVAGFGEATFVQAAGFLKIADGDNPLDATWIHPESYEVARQALERLGFSLADLRQKDTTAAIAQKVAEFNGQTERLAADWHVGLMTLRDILAQLTRPGRDPREDLPAPIFKRGVLKLEDLQPGMELMGSVLNVVDFGAFVDIGLHDSGLVHVSQLANRFVRDPHDVVSVGDIVKVWVMEIDKTRRRVSLTMIPPGTPKHEPRPRQARPESRPGEPAADGQRPPRRSRPPRRRDVPAVGAQEHPPSAAAAPEGQSASAQGHQQERGTGAAVPARQYPAGRGVRPPHVGRKPYGRSHDRSGQQHTHSRPKPKPKPLIPITKAMKEGKEPLRTFGDLMQFYQYQSSQDAPTASPPKAQGEPKTGESGPSDDSTSSAQAAGSGHEMAGGGQQSPQTIVNAPPEPSPATVDADNAPHASNGAEAHREIEATQPAGSATIAPADSTV